LGSQTLAASLHMGAGRRLGAAKCRGDVVVGKLIDQPHQQRNGLVAGQAADVIEDFLVLFLLTQLVVRSLYRVRHYGQLFVEMSLVLVPHPLAKHIVSGLDADTQHERLGVRVLEDSPAFLPDPLEGILESVLNVVRVTKNSPNAAGHLPLDGSNHSVVVTLVTHPVIVLM